MKEQTLRKIIREEVKSVVNEELNEGVNQATSLFKGAAKVVDVVFMGGRGTTADYVTFTFSNGQRLTIEGEGGRDIELIVGGPRR